jgi:hypothetical protein
MFFKQAFEAKSRQGQAPWRAGLEALDVGMRLNSTRASNSDQAKIVSPDPTVQANPVADASPR